MTLLKDVNAKRECCTQCGTSCFLCSTQNAASFMRRKSGTKVIQKATTSDPGANLIGTCIRPDGTRASAPRYAAQRPPLRRMATIFNVLIFEPDHRLTITMMQCAAEKEHMASCPHHDHDHDHHDGSSSGEDEPAAGPADAGSSATPAGKGVTFGAGVPTGSKNST